MKIDKEQIKSFIKQIPKKIWQWIKNVYELPHSGKYLFLSMILLIVFLLLTFPYDFLILKKIYDLEGKSFKSIDLPVFNFSIIGDTVIERPTIILNNNDEITCEKTTIATPNPISLLLNKKIKSNFSITLLKYILKDAEVLITIHQGNVELSLDKQSNMPTTGSLQTEVINIVMRPVNISIPTDFGPILFKKDSIIINSQGIDCTITNGVLKFDNFKFTGDITAEISGSLGLINKKLDLTISIDTDIKEFEPYKDLLTKYIKNDRITIRIGGTIDKPDPRLIEKGKDEN